MGRLQNTIQRIGLKRLVASVVTGGVLTVAVAWWFEMEPLNLLPVPFSWSKYTDSTGYRPLPNSDGERLRYWALDWSTGCDWLQVYNRPLDEIHESVRDEVRNAAPEPLPGWNSIGVLAESNRIVIENRSGWPLRCLRSTGTIGPILPGQPESNASGPLEHSVSMPLWATDLLDPASPELPIGVMPGRFALNLLFYATMTYPLLSIPVAIRHIRRRLTNRCTACGYSLDNLTADTCPECGKFRQ